MTGLLDGRFAWAMTMVMTAVELTEQPTHRHDRRSGSGLWGRVRAARWPFTPAAGKAFDVEVRTTPGLRQLADLSSC